MTKYKISCFTLAMDGGLVAFHPIRRAMQLWEYPTQPPWKSVNKRMYQFAEAIPRNDGGAGQKFLRVRWRRIISPSENEQVHTGKLLSASETPLSLPPDQHLLSSCHAVLCDSGHLAFQENRDCGTLNQFCAHLRKSCKVKFNQLAVLDESEYEAMMSGELTAKKIEMSYDATNRSETSASPLLGLGGNVYDCLQQNLQKGTINVGISQPGFALESLKKLLPSGRRKEKDGVRTCKVYVEGLDHPIDLFLKRRIGHLNVDLSQLAGSDQRIGMEAAGRYDRSGYRCQ